MAELISLLRNVSDLNGVKGVLRSYLSSCSEQLAFSMDRSKEPSIVSLINSKLNEPLSRYDGLLLLQAFLPQCSLEVLGDNASAWMLMSLKGVSVPSTCPIAFEVLKMLFSLTKELPEMTKLVSASIIPNLAEQLNREHFSQGLLQALECLTVCFEKYNGPCGPHKRVWDHFLIPLVDYSGQQAQSVQWQAARCVALLPQLGGGGTGGTMYASAWSDQQKVLCISIHQVLDELFSDVNEVQTFQASETLEDIASLNLKKLQFENPVLKAQMLTLRLSGLVTYLQAMLLGKFPVAKKISISSILNLVCRGLAINTTSFASNTTTHSLALVSVLPKVHICLLNLLSSLIVVCRTNLLPFSALICKLAIQTLKWTSVEKWPYGVDKPYRSLRVQVYRLLVQWCTVAKRGSLIEDVAEQLADMALSDFIIQQDAVLLSADLLRRNKYANRMHLKKQKTNIQMNQASLTNGHREHNSINAIANVNLCIAALQATRAMIVSSSTAVGPSVHKMLQEAVCSVLLDVTRKDTNSPIPYSSSAARLELYQMLLALVLNPHPVWPPPLGLSLKMFACGINDKNLQVSMLCSTALACVEKIIHPSHASLHFKVPTEEVVAIAQSSQQHNTEMETEVDGSSSLSEEEMDVTPAQLQADHSVSIPVNHVVNQAIPTSRKECTPASCSALDPNKERTPTPKSALDSEKRCTPTTSNALRSPKECPRTTSNKKDNHKEECVSHSVSSLQSTSTQGSVANTASLQEDTHSKQTSQNSDMPSPVLQNKIQLSKETRKIADAESSSEAESDLELNAGSNEDQGNGANVECDEESLGEIDIVECEENSNSPSISSTGSTISLLLGRSDTVSVEKPDNTNKASSKVAKATEETNVVSNQEKPSVEIEEISEVGDLSSEDELTSSQVEVIFSKNVEAASYDKKHHSKKEASPSEIIDLEMKNCHSTEVASRTEIVDLEAEAEVEIEVESEGVEVVDMGGQSPVHMIEVHLSPVVTPRVLRSRTISNSSCGSTPGKKKARKVPSPLAPTFEVEEDDESSPKKKSPEDDHDQPRSKKLKFNNDDDEDDDEFGDKLETMLSTFVDVTNPEYKGKMHI